MLSTSGIPIIKFSCDLSLPLFIIFNKSIELGSCPIKCKYSFITLI